jgi:ATP/maltotriose-dependent transcriptional regulator MalT/DNA-binding SARP family transcriptional activator
MPVSYSRNIGQVQRASGTIERPRLLVKLQSVLEYKLTLISAPPGYGKTTLASQFVQQIQVPVAWHTIEERDRDVPNLYSQCLSALAPLVPGIEDLTPLPGGSPAELAALLANHLRENLRKDIILILDDVQNLAGSPAAETWLRTLVRFVPSNCHLVLVSRILPDLPLTEMIARREVLAIGQQELQFTPDEVQALAVRVLGLTQSTIDVRELTTRLEGWPAGIILALYPLPPELERVMLSGGKGPEALFDALANSMLYSQAPGLRDFLLASSTLTRMTPELCTQALQLEDSAYWLEEAQNRSLFLSRASGGLVYHALFRNFLQRQLKAFHPEQYTELHVRAATWFDKNNYIDEAFDHYVSASYIAQAASISERVAQSYFAQGKTETLLSWSNRLSSHQVDVPRLHFTCAMIHTDRYDYDNAESALSLAERGFAALGQTDGIASVQIQRSMINFQKGHNHEAAGQAMALLQSGNLPDNLRARATNLIGLSQLRLGNPQAAVNYLTTAAELYRADGDAYALSQSLQDLVTAYLYLGRSAEAGECLQEVVALCRSMGSASKLALALNNLGYYYHVRSDYRQAQTTLEEGLSVAARVLDRRAEGYLLWSLGDINRDQGAFDNALRLYDKALELSGSSEPALRSGILVSASILRRWQGRYSDSIAFAEEANALANAHSIGLERILSRGMVNAARANDSDKTYVLRQLESIDRDLDAMGANFDRLRFYAIRAEISLGCGDTTGARELIQKAFQLGKQTGSTQPFTAEVFHLPNMRAYVAGYASKPEAFVEEMKELQSVQPKPMFARAQDGHMTVNSNTYSLRVSTFGIETIERDGKLVASSEWRATSARELFLYLLFIGPQSREDLSLVFWPESGTKQVRSNFHTTLYRARRALGENVIVFQDGQYHISNDLDLQSDAHELKTLTAQARLMPVRDARTEDLWHRAVSLYNGEFLSTLDAEWVYPLRESFREMYLEALIGLGECARARNDYRHALNIYKQALQVDPYREDIHRAVMTCYAQKGEKRKILSHLNELQQLLWQELAVKPSSETMTLVRSLLS